MITYLEKKEVFRFYEKTMGYKGKLIVFIKFFSTKKIFFFNVINELILFLDNINCKSLKCKRKLFFRAIGSVKN